MAKTPTITYTCRVLPELAQMIKNASQERGLSQAKILTMAIKCLTEGKAERTQSSTSSQKGNTDNGVFEVLKEELQFKNKTIERLLETINQLNHLMAAKERNLLIEHQEVNEETEEPIIISSPKKKPKKSKSKKKK